MVCHNFPIIVFGEQVFDLFFASGTFVKKVVTKIAFATTGFEAERFHEAVAGALTISGNRAIHMKGEQTKRAVVSAAAPQRFHFFSAIETGESVIARNEIGAFVSH